MRIGIGLNLFQPDTGGVGNYALTLLRHWPQLAPEHPMVLFTFDHNEEMLALLPPESRRHEYRLKVQEDVHAHLGRIDLYFCPFGSLWPRPMPLPTALTFHDMQERFYPEFFTPAQRRERFFPYDWSLRMADAVIAVSDFTRRSCIDILQISRWKIRRVHHAPDELPEPAMPADWKPAGWEKFLFYPANLWAHKNHERLLQALRRLHDEGLPVRCVLTGSLFGRDEEFRQMAISAGVADCVRHLGRRPRPEVSWLFHHARGLIFPSIFEGFGIPIVEAMQSGCPVACSGVTSLPEVARAHALYFDPTDVGGIAQAAARLWNDDALCAKLATGGRLRAADFNARRLIAGHLEAFKLAHRLYHPWKHWYRERYQRPRSEKPRHELTAPEKRAAQRLLRRVTVTG